MKFLCTSMISLVGFIVIFGCSRSEMVQVDVSQDRTATPRPSPILEPTSTPPPEPRPSPILEPTSTPTSEPTSSPSPEPTSVPTRQLTSTPTPEPTSVPMAEPTSTPTPEPTSVPTPEPASTPTPEPTSVPTPDPTSTSTPIPTPTPTAVAVGVIKQTFISQVMFSERDISVVKDTTVIWENLDPFDHTVTSESGVFDSGRFSSGKKFEFNFSDLGTFGYICTIHSNMDGFVIVYEEGSPTPVPTVVGDQKMSPGYSY